STIRSRQGSQARSTQTQALRRFVASARRSDFGGRPARVKDAGAESTVQWAALAPRAKPDLSQASMCARPNRTPSLRGNVAPIDLREGRAPRSLRRLRVQHTHEEIRKLVRIVRVEIVRQIDTVLRHRPPI